jgi:uncharacterized protein
MPRGSRRLPKECLQRLESAELILHGGDVVAASVLERLRELAPVEAVAGNMDEPELLAELPQRRVVELDEARIGMVHVPGPAAGRSERFPTVMRSSMHTRTSPRFRDSPACGS